MHYAQITHSITINNIAVKAVFSRFKPISFLEGI